ncbi:MAG TPA: group II intron reverse transcriptase/maturase [Puia sp.]|nr:group II intron reverse transcriptase/maturase [Puia sp.]
MLQTTRKPFEIRFDRIVAAYRAVKANKGSHGVDDVSLEAYEEDLQGNLYKLWNRLSSGSYFPQAVRQVEIAKKSGGKRPLGIPTVSDRVAQAVVKRELEIKLEPIFHADSYGYRPHRSTQDALRQTRVRCWKYQWVVDLDIQSFFEDIPHELLMKAVRKHTDCKWHLLYIERWLQAPVQQADGSLKRKEKGVPQGGVASPLLANLFLHYCFDEWMSRKIGHCPFERYADDIVLHCKTRKQAMWVKHRIEERFGQCGLKLHPVKTKLVDCRTDESSRESKHQEFDFLGHTFRKRATRSRVGHYFTSYLPAVSKQSIKGIREKLKASEALSRVNNTLSDIATELNPQIRGWFNGYGQFYASELKKQLQCINGRLLLWVRRKYKRLRNRWKALAWLRTIAKGQPALFEHWRQGVIPCVRQ